MSDTIVAPETPRLKKQYNDEIKPALFKEFGHENINQVARLVKVVVNMGVGEAAKDRGTAKPKGQQRI